MAKSLVINICKLLEHGIKCSEVYQIDSMGIENVLSIDISVIRKKVLPFFGALSA